MRYRSAPHNNRDAIEPDIVAALAKIGVEWNECGPLDGWVYRSFVVVEPSGLRTFKRFMVPVELKDPHKRNWKPERKYTRQQREFFEYCKRNDLPYFIWHSVEECLADMGAK